MVRGQILVCYRHYCLPFAKVLTLYLGCIWLVVPTNRLCVSSCLTSCTDRQILRQCLGWTSVTELELVVLSLHVLSCQPTFVSCSTVTKSTTNLPQQQQQETSPRYNLPKKSSSSNKRAHNTWFFTGNGCKSCIINTQIPCWCTIFARSTCSTWYCYSFIERNRSQSWGCLDDDDDDDGGGGGGGGVCV